MTKKEEIHAAMQALLAIAEAVREAGEIPAGVLFAAVCQYMSADQFNGFIEKLVNAKLISRAPSHLLTWTGPK